MGRIDRSCCNVGSYHFSFSGVKISPAVAGMMVLPVDVSGFEIPMGEIAHFVDAQMTTTLTTATTTTKAAKGKAASAAHQRRLMGVAACMALVVAVNKLLGEAV